MPLHGFSCRQIKQGSIVVTPYSLVVLMGIASCNPNKSGNVNDWRPTSICSSRAWTGRTSVLYWTRKISASSGLSWARRPTFGRFQKEPITMDIAIEQLIDVLVKAIYSFTERLQTFHQAISVWGARHLIREVFLTGKLVGFKSGDLRKYLFLWWWILKRGDVLMLPNLSWLNTQGSPRTLGFPVSHDWDGEISLLPFEQQTKLTFDQLPLILKRTTFLFNFLFFTICFPTIFWYPIHG